MLGECLRLIMFFFLHNVITVKVSLFRPTASVPSYYESEVGHVTVKGQQCRVDVIDVRERIRAACYFQVHEVSEIGGMTANVAASACR